MKVIPAEHYRACEEALIAAALLWGNNLEANICPEHSRMKYYAALQALDALFSPGEYPGFKRNL